MRSKIFVFAITIGAIVLLGISYRAKVVSAQAAGDRARTVGTNPAVTPTPVPTTSPTPAIDDPNETIKIDAELVNLDVRVIDRNNRPINDVQQKDFKIYEDGVPQTIDFFSKSEVPTNYSLVVDNSGSMRQLLEKVIDAGKTIVATNKPQDETSIIRFVGREKITIEQDFTSNKADLTDALDNMFIEGGQTAIIDAVYLATQNLDEYERSKKVEDRKRRALILVTDGEDRDSFYSEQQLSDLLKESEVQIFVVGFLGELSKEGNFIGKSQQAKSKAFLERLANETGGKAYFPDNISEMPAIGKDIAAELRTQYSIGYIPTNDAKDGTYRNIKVVVDDGPDKQKRIALTRPGRTAGGGTATPPKPANVPAKPQK